MPLPPLLVECLSTSVKDGQKLAKDLLERNGYKPEVSNNYVYGAGTIPILMVAHTDTVHDAPPRKVYHDPNHRIIWSPTGLGADDRAGVYGIALLLEEGFRPHVLFTDGEESGGIGADEAAHTLDKPPVRIMLQLDRAGADHYVTYSCENKRMNRYLKAHGLSEEIGTYSDIATLMPAWGIAGANLAVGYYSQHSRNEYMNLNELDDTLKRVRRMLKQPPSRKLSYESRYKDFHYFRSGPLFRDPHGWRSLDAGVNDTHSYPIYVSKDEQKRRDDYEKEYQRLLTRDDEIKATERGASCAGDLSVNPVNHHPWYHTR